MFKNTTEEFKAQLVKELIAFENANIPAKENKEDMASVLAGYIHYKTNDDVGKINLEVGLKYPCTSLVKYVTGKVAIVIKREDFVSKNFTELEAMIAHELGHYLCRHFDEKDSDYLSMYEAESKAAIDNDDQDSHVYWTSKAVADGGYVVREMEADLVAAHFVGIGNVFHMQMSDAFEHDNLTVTIEKLNRLKYLNNHFKEIVTPVLGYEMTIELIKLVSVQNQGT